MATPVIETFLESAHLAFSNLQTDSELNTPMAAFGYDTAKISGLMALYDAAAAAYFTQKTEYAQQYGATVAYEAARETAHTTYTRHLQLARIVYKNNATRANQLGLPGDRRQSYTGWKFQADQFYKAALADAAIQTDLAAVGITLTALQDAKALIDNTDDAWHTQQTETGEAQDATKARDEALDKLQDAFSDMIAVARVAFADDAQKLERMGIVVSSE